MSKNANFEAFKENPEDKNRKLSLFTEAELKKGKFRVASTTVQHLRRGPSEPGFYVEKGLKVELVCGDLMQCGPSDEGNWIENDGEINLQLFCLEETGPSLGR